MAEHDNWDEHWSRYDEAARRNPAQQMRHAILLKLLRGELGEQSGKVLDLGSGQGDFLEKLSAAFPRLDLVGFELSESGVEISRRKLPQAKFIAADLFNPPADLMPYHRWASHAVCSEVLEHVDSPTLFLQAARTYLVDDARLIVTVPGGPMSAFDRHIGHRQHFTRDSIRATLASAGFTVDRIYLSGFPFFNLYRGVVIARGRNLATDVQSGGRGFSSRLANGVMRVFRLLFRLNLLDSPFGWQVVAVARKRRD
jgi:SAM-dependent methyltransferase